VPAEAAKTMEAMLEKAHKSPVWKDHATRHYYEDRYLGSADYARFLVQRMEEYKDFYAEVGATVKPAP
jgi:tripartite-type tricarboxylate transporter receptor subunit TctC